MRSSAWLAGITAPLLAVGLAAAPVALATTSTQSSNTTQASTLYVYIGASGCNNAGPGTEAEPFCTVQAAANVVQAGQTVQVRSNLSGDAGGTVTISSKGTAAEPITFVYEQALDPAIMSAGAQTDTPVVKFDGAQYITFSSFDIQDNASGDDGVDVDGSSNITLENLNVTTLESTGISVDGASSNVTIERSQVEAGNHSGVLAAAGASGVALIANRVSVTNGPGITLDGATGSVVTSNTVLAGCTSLSGAGNALVFADGSSGTAENNILESGRGADCPAPASAGLLVDSGSVAGVTTGYNAIFISAGSEYYSWAGTQYSTIGAFQAAVPGQGTNDESLSTGFLEVPPEGSPVIDSANCSATDEPSTDILGNPRVQDPLATDASLANGTCYADRGAYERGDTLSAITDATSPSVNSTGSRVQPVSSPFAVTITAAVTSSWNEAVSYTVDFGDGTAPVNATVGTAATHVYTSPGQYTVTITATDTSGSSEQTTVAFDAMSAAPPAVTLSMEPAGAVAQIVPDEADFTYSAGSLAWEVASASIANGDGTTGDPMQPSDPGANWAHIYNKPGTYTATVTVTDLLGRTSTGKVTFVVGDGLAAPNSPTTDYNHAVGAHDTVKLSPVGGDCCTRGALVDVRVTNPKDTGSIVVYQNGTTRPDLATVQFHAGQAAENSAWVAVDFGDVDFYNTSGGTLDLNVTTFAIEDGTTYEAAPPEQTYHPVTPGQVLARTELAPQHKTVVTAAGVPADADDLVLDITESGSTATGTMITYGENIGTSSQVEVSSWSKGQQVTGLSMVPVNGGRVILVNDSKGNAYFTADVVGYTYFPYPPSAGETFDPATDGSVFLPATPDRLLKVTVAGKHWVKVAVAGKDGIPAASTGGAGTTAALVTLTAASTTANGSFTAYADGTSRPANVISLSYTSGQTAANTAIVQVGQDGEIDLYNGGSKPVLAVLDVDGSFYGY